MRWEKKNVHSPHTDMQKIILLKNEIKISRRVNHIEAVRRWKCEDLHCRDQLPASLCTASAYPLSSSHLGRNWRTEGDEKLTFRGINETQISDLWEWLLSVRCHTLSQCEGHIEEGDCRNWCSLCLMYRPACSAVFASWQRCLVHPEIHYRSVSSIHLNVALQLQITTNDPPPLSTHCHHSLLLGNIPIPISLPLSITLSDTSLSACFLFSSNLCVEDPTPLLPLQPPLSVKYRWPCNMSECIAIVLTLQKIGRLPHYTEL